MLVDMYIVVVVVVVCVLFTVVLAVQWGLKLFRSGDILSAMFSPSLLQLSCMWNIACLSSSDSFFLSPSSGQAAGPEWHSRCFCGRAEPCRLPVDGGGAVSRRSSTGTTDQRASCGEGRSGSRGHSSATSNPQSLFCCQVERHVSDAVSKGGEVVLGGGRCSELGPSFYHPSIITKVHAWMYMCVRYNVDASTVVSRINAHTRLQAHMIVCFKRTWLLIGSAVLGRDIIQDVPIFTGVNRHGDGP